jgi:hypothetical protein
MLLDRLKEIITSCKESRLKLNGCGIFDKHIEVIVALINQNRIISSLQICQNNLTDIGIKFLAYNLKNVTHIDLEQNDCSDQGLIALLANKQIEHIGLKRNMSISNKNGDVLQAIRTNTTCRSIELEGTFIDPADKQQINNHLLNNIQNKLPEVENKDEQQDNETREFKTPSVRMG